MIVKVLLELATQDTYFLFAFLNFDKLYKLSYYHPFLLNNAAKDDKVTDFYANVTCKVPVLVSINEFCVAKFQHFVRLVTQK